MSEIEIAFKTLDNTEIKTDIKRRKKYLKDFRKAVKAHKEELCNAVFKDLGRSTIDVEVMEIYPLLEEIKHAIKHTKKWAKPREYKTPFGVSWRTTCSIPEPRGKALIMAPWNFPLLLSLDPLVDALSAGNACFVSVSSRSPHTSNAVKKVITEVFPSEIVHVYGGAGTALTKTLFQPGLQPDVVCFTGSPTVGRIIHAKCNEALIPCLLELGGKSPFVVLPSNGKKTNEEQEEETKEKEEEEEEEIDASLKEIDLQNLWKSPKKFRTLCERFAWAKGSNSGQICVNADYGFIPRRLIPAFVAEAKRGFNQHFPQITEADIEEAKNDEYTEAKVGETDGTAEDLEKRKAVGRPHNMGLMVTEDAARNILEEVKRIENGDIEGMRVLHGGLSSLPDGVTVEDAVKARYVPFTLVEADPTKNTKGDLLSREDNFFLQSEIFGPVFPIIPYDELDEAVKVICSKEHPLTYYVGAENPIDRRIQTLRMSKPAGSLVVNDFLMQSAISTIPFGGIGNSGLGQYHGQEGFDFFSHVRPVMVRDLSSALDEKVRFPGKSKYRKSLLKFMLK